jgi:hypothetical protein
MTTLGAIRWDAWYTNTANSPGRYTAASLSPTRWQSRAPVHGVLGRNKVSWAATQATMDAEIAAAVTCLDYWAFIKYPSGPAGLRVGWDLYQSSANKNDINWCWINETSRLGTTGNYATPVSEIVSTMQQSNYQKVLTNRPLLYILYSDSDLTAYWGGNNANLKAALDSIRSGATGAGLGDPYIVLMRSSPTTAGPIKTALACDALSSYIPVAPTTFDNTWASFDATTQAYWATLAANSATIVPIASAGWNQVPRIEIVNPYVANKPYFKTRQAVTLPTNLELTAHIEDAFAYVAANPLVCDADTIILYAWNEHDEGGWIAPSYGDPNGGRCAAVAAARP